MTEQQKQDVIAAIHDFRETVNGGSKEAIKEALDIVMDKAREAGVTREQMSKLQDEV